MDITRKSTGTLMDELTVTRLKKKFIGNKPEINKRELAITHAIAQRITPEQDAELNALFQKLTYVNNRCWVAQENIMNLDVAAPHIGRYAKNAQKLNAKRNMLIREIDRLLGEEEFTQLEKSYGN